MSLGLETTGIDLARFVTFTPAGAWQCSHWLVLGEPKAGANGYARFNNRVGRFLGTIALHRGGGYAVVLEFDDGQVESFGAGALCPAPGLDTPAT